MFIPLNLYCVSMRFRSCDGLDAVYVQATSPEEAETTYINRCLRLGVCVPKGTTLDVINQATGICVSDKKFAEKLCSSRKPKSVRLD